MTVVMLLQVNQKCFFPQYGVDYTWGAAGSLRSSILLHLRWKEPVGMEICKWEFKSSLMVPWETKVLILRTFRLAFNQEKNRKYEVEHIVSNLSNFHSGKVQGQAIYSPMGFSCTCVQPCAQNIENRLFDAISIIIPHFTIILRMWPWNSSFFIFRNQNMEVWLFQAIPAVP